jgi:hypothetical protein
MHDAHAVGVTEPQQRLAEQRDGLLAGNGAAPLNHAGEGLALDKLHHHPRRAALHQKRVERGQVHVVQAGLGARLGAKTLFQFRIPGELGRQRLEGDHAVERNVDGLVHHPHAALAELVDNPIACHHGTDHLAFPRSIILPAATVQ